MAIRGTTPDYILTVEGADLTDKTVLVTIRQGLKTVNRTNDALLITSHTVETDTGTRTDSTIAFTLSQEETLYLHEGNASVQVKFVDSLGQAEATTEGTIHIDRALYEKVIEYVPGD